MATRLKTRVVTLAAGLALGTLLLAKTQGLGHFKVHAGLHPGPMP